MDLHIDTRDKFVKSCIKHTFLLLYQVMSFFLLPSFLFNIVKMSLCNFLH